MWLCSFILHAIISGLFLFLFVSGVGCGFTSRYLDALLNIDNIYFEQMVNRIYSAELHLIKANSSDTDAPFFGFESVHF